MKKNTLPWGTIILVFLIFVGLYLLYPSDNADNGDVISSLFYAIGIIVGTVILIFCWFLFRPIKKDKAEEKKPKGDDETKKVAEKEKPSTGDNRFAEKVVLLLLMVAGIFFWGAIPYDDVPPIPAEGMLFVPTWGLLKAFLVGTFFATLWSFFDETGTSNGAGFAVILAIIGLVVFYWSIKEYWFAPIVGDPSVSSVTVFIGIAILVWIIGLKMKNAVEYVVIAGFVATAIWLPQMA